MGGENPQFIVDAMLGTTAKKLRLAGFDAVYASGCEDGHILEAAAEQRRIIVTRDAKLYTRALKAGLPALLPAGGDSLDHVLEITEMLGLKVKIDAASSRCTTCNGELQDADRGAVRNQELAKLPVSTRLRQCIECGKVYWHGSHIDRLQRSLAGRATQRDAAH